MGYEIGIDTEALHWRFWDHRDRRDEFKINETELAEELLVTRGRVSHIIKAMRDDGRISRPAGSRGPYRVMDPAGFVES